VAAVVAELLTQCFDGTTPSGLGPINPTSNFPFPFLTSFFNEIAQVFPDDYIHVGGDEVPYNCW
jgi:hexosaminidase